MVFERLQLNLLSLFEQKLLPDVTVVSEGKEIPAHKVVLAAQSDWFLHQFQIKGPGHCVIELDKELQIKEPDKKYSYKIVYGLIRFMYFGGLQSDLGPVDGLDMLVLSEELKVKALDQEDLLSSVIPQLNLHNCLDVLYHHGLARYPSLQAGVCEFVGHNFLRLLRGDSRPELFHIDFDIPDGRPKILTMILRAACETVFTADDSEDIVQFCREYHSHSITSASQFIPSSCDLLRDSKQWNWGADKASLLRSLEEPKLEGFEWTLSDVRSAMEPTEHDPGTPGRIVVGHFFDWCIKLDYGAEGKLRIVYERADAKATSEGEARCIDRFPAAMFAWRVIYRGQDVFHEKPVFICFPQNAELHWSTTLPVSAQDLADDDELKIMVNMAENPILSLILYYFSSDLKKTVDEEDILNRLPHIEYRCLSSYVMKSHLSVPS